jgi:starch phosphorylase
MLQPEFAGRVVFLEDYDIQLARWLVTGVDVWLNNPIAPLEASGTSGIKAAINGRLNLSILDGWWAEAFDGENGWGIPGADVQDGNRRDELDSDTILDAIEEDVLPLYYARNARGLSPEWVRRCKRAMRTVMPRFNMRRTVRDYVAGMYRPAALQGERLAADRGVNAERLAEWKRRVYAAWDRVSIRPLPDVPRDAQVAAPLVVKVAVNLGGLDPADVRVEFKARRQLPEAVFEPAPLCSFGHGLPNGQWREQLRFTGERDADGAALFEMSAVAPSAGQYLPELRVYPWNEMLTHPLEMGLMKRV